MKPLLEAIALEQERIYKMKEELAIKLKRADERQKRLKNRCVREFINKVEKFDVSVLDVDFLVGAVTLILQEDRRAEAIEAGKKEIVGTEKVGEVQDQVDIAQVDNA